MTTKPDTIHLEWVDVCGCCKFTAALSRKSAAKKIRELRSMFIKPYVTRKV